MTYAAVKEKLHSYIENADQKKIKAIYALLENDIEHGSYSYDEVTLSALEKISEDAFSGKTKTYSVKDSISNIERKRAKNAI